MLQRPAQEWLAAAWLVALVATLGSLYFSEIRHFVPCTLCWYQRIAMYPLVILLGIAAWNNDAGVWRYALPLSGIGTLLAALHRSMQQWPAFFGEEICQADVPCSGRYINWFGFITIPTLALIAFALIDTLLLVAMFLPSELERRT